MGRMQGKTAVITGAGSGIGKETALLFAREGARVAIADISLVAAKEVEKEIVDLGGDAVSCEVDVANKYSVDAFAAAVDSTLGAITTLVNCAGIFDDNAPLHETDEAHWDRVIAVDLKGIYLVSHAFLGSLQKSETAAIVNLSSISGLVANGGGFAYTAAKHGVIGMTKAIAAEYGPGIRCNAILPGAVLTNMTKDIFGDEGGLGSAFEHTAARRYAHPKELANAILFAASDDASFMYGAQIVVDGGWTVV